MFSPTLFNDALYLVSVALLALALNQVRRFALALRIPVLLTVCTAAGLLLWLTSLIPGALRALTPVTAGLNLCFLSLLTMALLRRQSLKNALAAEALPTEGKDRDGTDGVDLLCNIATVLFVVGILASHDLQGKRIWQVILPTTPLGFDTVTYHMPGLVEIYQTHSLWSLINLYQSYSYAFELIGGYPALFFQSHYGTVLAYIYAFVFWVAAVRSIFDAIMRGVPLLRTASRGAAFLVTLVLAFLLFGKDALEVGKNDMFVTACVLASFAFLLLRGQTDAEHAVSPLRQNTLLLLSAIALGLGLATKPIALAYVPLFVLMLAFYPTRTTNKSESRTIARNILVFSVLVIVIGGFFLVRNLLAFGQLNDPAFTDVWQHTIRANLLNPRLYKSGKAMLLVVITLMSPLFLVAMGRRTVREGESQRWPASLLWVLGFLITAGVAFIVTPYSIQDDNQPALTWTRRLGGIVFTLAAMAWAIALSPALTRLLSRWNINATSRVRDNLPTGLARVRSAWITVPAIFFLGGIMPFVWGRHAPVGLPGYESVNDLPPTGIYRWVQAQQHPQRILEDNLRPYGLYGGQWRNRVFQDRSKLDDPSHSQAELMAAIHRIHPDLVIISIPPQLHLAPDSSYTALQKPLADWMHGQPCFKEVYADPIASAFLVKNECQE